ncbi:translation initiation factor IF-2 [Dichotomicrobium thermohalophilum]|uniref:Translation initiation factor IF-2 n=1 Tax=Dichotomicrobium thermohalophilum TaxID=933063 RepID=A0A397PHK2_9HYPH|nr:translation initiation factor IF-2 [Dichotomicrobium thermohalophilum]RIA47359.1 translation initiation factor 2 (bIF-2) [Dichotomicrobium thermohalophilum]
MSDTKETESGNKRTSRKTMTLNLGKSVEQGRVRQSFSHGRSKSVLVEKKRKRTAAPPAPQAESTKPAAPAAEKPAETKARGDGEARAEPKAEAKQTEKSERVLRQLSEEERDARIRALNEARKREEAERKERERRAAEEAERERQRAAEEAKRQAEEEARKQAEAAEAEAQAPEGAEAPEAEPAQAEAKTEVQQAEAAEEAPATETEAPAEARKRPAKPAEEAEEETRKGKGEARGKKGRAEQRPAPKRPAGEERRARSKLTLANALDDDQRERSLASLRRHRERQKKQAAAAREEGKKIKREVQIPEAITIQELANRMTERAVDVIKFLMKQGQMHKINDVIEADLAELIVIEFGHTPKRVSEADVEEGFLGGEDREEDLEPRAPVVTVMGHVDHGKTSLLDALRKENVVAGEAGGITQHIGAYQVETESGHPVTFIDTPGHAAFTSMRARGAKVTDVVVLVVAADDGVMPQTIEAIDHAKAAGVPIVVAINKIDKPDSDPNRVRTELLQHEVIVESMSGETLEVEVSALKHMNLDKLLEAIQLQAELLELKANPDRPAEGVVIEAKLERGRGPVATVLVQRGTLKVGQVVVAGRSWGKVRALISDRGENTVQAGPSQPVEILGLDSAPEAGDQFAVVENEARAREITDYRQRKLREVKAAGAGTRGSLEKMMSQLGEEGAKEFPLIIKGDVQGSVEAITSALEKLGTDEVEARVVHAGVGGVTESDVTLAKASDAAVVGFNVRANAQARQAARQEGIEIRYYNVIYDLVDDIKAAMSGLLEPTLRETFLGNAEILEVFNITKVGKVAGCRVTEGKVERGAGVRLIRDNVVVHEGKLSTLKRFKDEVKEVQVGQECGMSFENYQDIRKGDIIECYRVEKVERSL